MRRLILECAKRRISAGLSASASRPLRCVYAVAPRTSYADNRVQAVKHPEKEAERRVKRNEQKTRSKKRKAAHFADTKLRYGQTGRKKSRQD